MAGGLGPTSSPKSARILRTTTGSAERKEIRVDLKAMLAGKAADARLQPDDILFVPGSTTKKLGAAALGTLVTTGTTVAIWGTVSR